MSLRVPVTAHAGTVMGNLDAVFRLTHIGARTLERLLYAMDPHENNESIVRQRALLKKGTPRWIEVLIRNGNLSLTGEVAVGGSTIQLPAIRRLSVASLPIRKQIQDPGRPVGSPFERS
jgi:translocation and assembly module TamB